MHDTNYDRKNFNLDFFSGLHHSQDSKFCIFSILEEIGELDVTPHYRLGSFDYQLRSLDKSGNTIKGVLAKFRTSDLPHAGSPDGTERELGLEGSEGLIEKNHFVVKKDKCVIVFQRNGHAARVGRLSEYLTCYAGETIVFNPILQKDSFERLLDDDLKPVSLELSYATPTNPDLFPEDDWGKRMAMLSDMANGSRIRVALSADRRSSDHEKHSLSNRIKESIALLANERSTTVARVKLTDDVYDYPIDLIADRMTADEEVEMRGRYPVLDSMFSALQRAYSERKGDIDEIFGEPDRRLS
ncbi:DUF6731 family protein [Halomonas sp. PAMB 3232]|uniref:DUF6731 family protein n=1 Tax=Halomonas sp. PAMB 3232 TaxID=3075221 RepID=UPI00289CB1EF|nr:DUF6731 family protein [Halomonas sp. PAMB 3232]WNL38013.1 DUF6731 family protein [Halomonas sp. PAMB 3232]